MRLGIIGKPQCGKTTIFNAASGQQVTVGDFSKTTHRAVIKVPDDRLQVLAEIVNPKKVTHAEIEFIDPAGTAGADKQGPEFEVTPDLRQAEAFVMVVDAFSGQRDPKSDIHELIDEMMLVDQVAIERSLDKKGRKAQLTGDKSEQHEIDILKKCQAHLEAEKPLIDLDLDEADERALRGYMFLSQKPLLIVINIREEDIKRADEIENEFGSMRKEGRRDVVAVCGTIEMDLVSLGNEERIEFMEDLGIKSPAVDRVIQKSYHLLGLISYLTAGEPEVRAWTISRGTVAQKAAGVIHTDIERGFIRAEVTAFDDYAELKTAAALKAAGKTRLEGKEYVVQDGDVILFRFNV